MGQPVQLVESYPVLYPNRVYVGGELLREKDRGNTFPYESHWGRISAAHFPQINLCPKTRGQR